MKFILIILSLGVSCFSQELSKKHTYSLQSSVNLSDYDEFKSEWQRIPKADSFWEFERVTTDTPANSSNAEGRINIIEIHPNIPGLYLAGTSTNGLWKSTNFGETWSFLNIAEYNFGITKALISGENLNKILVLSGDSKIPEVSKSPFRGLYYSEDLGDSFVEIDISKLRTVPSDIEIFNDSYIVSTIDGIYKLEENELIEINHDLDLTNNLIYDILLLNNSRFAICLRDINNRSSEMHLVKYDNELTSFYSYASEEEQILFHPAFYEKPNSEDYIIQTLEIKNDSDASLRKLEFQGSNFVNESFHVLKDDFIRWQGEFNHALEIFPLDEKIVYGGGVNTHYTSNGGDSWLINMAGIHVDVHDYEFDLITGEVFAATDGGLYSQEILGEVWKYRSEGINAGQFFWGDVSDFNPNEFVGGKMDNGTFYKSFGESYATGGGDGMYCHFSDKKPEIFYQSFQRSRLSKYNTNESKQMPINSNKLDDTRRPWKTRFDVQNDSIWLYQDDLWLFSDSSWKNITKHNDSIKYAEKFDNRIIYQTDKGNIFELNHGEKFQFEVPQYDSLIISDMIIDGNLLIATTFPIGAPSILIFDLDERVLINELNILMTMTINCIEKSEDGFLLGTDDGVFRINSNFNSESVVNLYDRDSPIRGIRRLISKPEYGYIFAFTFSSDLRKLRISECGKEVISTNIYDTVYKCPNDIIEFSVSDDRFDNYLLNGKLPTKNMSIKEDGIYYFTANDNDCVVSSQKLIVVSDESSTFSASLLPFNKAICPDDSLRLLASGFYPYSSNDIYWNNGKKGEQIVIKEPGLYWANYVTENGCVAFSNTLTINEIFEEDVNRPEIILENGSLRIKDGSKVNWFRDEEFLISQNSVLVNPEFGVYRALAFADSCRLWSEDFVFEETGEIKINPNPALGDINIDILIDMKDDYSIEIIDINGNLVFEESYNKRGYNHITISTAKFSSGQYFFRLSGKSLFKNQKFIILK